MAQPHATGASITGLLVGLTTAASSLGCAGAGDDGVFNRSEAAGAAGSGAQASSSGSAGSGGSPFGGAGGTATGGAGFGGAGASSTGACPASPLAPGDHTVQLDQNGVARVYDLHVPASDTGTTPVPLVLYLHPLLTNKDYLKGAGTITKSDTEGFLAAFPDGLNSSWNAGACCGPSNGAGSTPAVDDVGFIRQVVASISQQTCVDPKRIYAAGFSNGGFLSHRLACEASDLFAAVAPDASVLGLAPSDCNPARPVPILQINGTADTLVPYNGGFFMAGITTAPFASVPDTFAGWALRDGCTGAPTETYRNGTVSCQSYSQCSGGVEVTECTVDNGGHCWFGEPLCVFGTNTTDINATDATWDFLKRYSMP